VFGGIESISQSEFFNAGQSGLKPDYKVIMWGFEYDGQEVVKIDDIKYSIYRTYQRKDDKIELYLIQKVGA
jgi:SPP1 family predicted phage head-tail adaptor